MEPHGAPNENPAFEPIVPLKWDPLIEPQSTPKGNPTIEPHSTPKANPTVERHSTLTGNPLNRLIVEPIVPLKEALNGPLALRTSRDAPRPSKDSSFR